MPVTSSYPSYTVQRECIHDVIFREIQQYDDIVALLDPGTNRKYTFKDVVKYSKNVAYGLNDLGVRKGSVLAIIAPNCVESTLLTLGALPLGGIISGVNPLYTIDEIVTYFKDCKCQFVLTCPELLNNVQKAASAVPGQIKKIFLTASQAAVETNTTVAPFASLLNYNSHGKPFPSVAIDPLQDIAFLLYSSGTTGVPKGVMITHWNVVFAMVTGAGRHISIHPGKGDHVIGLLPFFHIFGLLSALVCLRDGATCVLMPRYDSKLFLEYIQRYKVAFLAVVPPILVFLAKDPLIDQYDLTSVKQIVFGAAPVGKELLEDLVKRLPHIEYLIQGYGLTETTAVALRSPTQTIDPSKFGSCGTLVPNCIAKVLDVSSGRELGPNVDGEICVRSETVMRGYYNRPAATAETIDADGWLHTGDIGHYDDDGYFYIVDRLKELIKVKGFQVAPAELEDVLLSHPAIRDAAVIGLPDDLSGEIPRAFVVLKPNARATEREIVDFVAGKVAKYKHLKGGVEFCDSIPKSLSGKILRKDLKADYFRRSKL